jgi:PAS domain S-box-containing protein/diguanylate cyclase (GGDEF)-like protein
MSVRLGVTVLEVAASVAAAAGVIALLTGSETAAAVLGAVAIAALGACVVVLSRALTEPERPGRRSGLAGPRSAPDPESDLRRILDHAHDAHIAIDGAGRVLGWNAAAETTFGWRREEALGRLLSELIVPEHLRDPHQEGLDRFLETGHGPVIGRRTELTGLHRDGAEIPVEVSVVAIEEDGEVVFHGFVRDLTERRLLQAKQAALEAPAPIDLETGLANRQAWNEELERELARARRGEWALCVAVLELDGLGEITDARSDGSRDRLLRHAASAWRLAVRASDLVARYEGDGFAVLLPDCPVEEAMAVIGRLRHTTPGGQTVSAGVAEWNGYEGAQALIDRADFALYRAKRDGRDRVVVAA